MRSILAGLLFAAVAAGAAAADPTPRIISIGGSVTETVYALGGQSLLIADDQSSVYPDAARKLPQIGYMRTLAAEGILSLHPDLVLAAPEAGPKAALEQLAAAGVRLVKLDEGYTVEAALARITAVGKQIGREAEAKQITEAMTADLAAVQKQIDAAKFHPRVLFLMQIGHGAPLVAGGKTAADAMITLAGGSNAAGATFDGYKPLTPEGISALAPDYILVTDETLQARGGKEALIKMPEIAATTAAEKGCVAAMEALYLLGFGPRMAHALRDLAATLHPEQHFDAVPHHPWNAPQ